MKMTEEIRRTRTETYPSVTSSTTNPTRSDLELKPGVCCEKPATNLLNYVTCVNATLVCFFSINCKTVDYLHNLICFFPSFLVTGVISRRSEVHSGPYESKANLTLV